MSKESNKGFTLIELLVVIAIIAVLSIVVILTLNPAELLRQARDSNRISDLSTVKSAIALYLADITSPWLGTSTNAYEDVTSLANSTSTTSFNLTFSSQPSAGAIVTSTAPRAVDGTGWIPVKFTQISSGAPIGQLPVDPLDNDGGIHLYLYKASSTALTFKLAAKMESTKYSNTGTSDVESTDGGNNTAEFEAGTNLRL